MGALQVGLNEVYIMRYPRALCMEGFGLFVNCLPQEHAVSACSPTGSASFEKLWGL